MLKQKHYFERENKKNNERNRKQRHLTDSSDADFVLLCRYTKHSESSKTADDYP